MDQGDSGEHEADLPRCAREMQSAAVSTGYEGGTSRQLPAALRVSLPLLF